MDTDKLFNLDDAQLPPMPGSLLVAKPTVDDPVFGRSVVLLTEHNDQGSMGLIVNSHPGDMFKVMVPRVSPEMCSVPLFQGGPVGTDRMFYVHSLGPQTIPASRPLGNGLYFVGELVATMTYLAAHRDGGADGIIKLFMGYSGWEAGQLQREIDRHDWAVLDSLPAATVLSYRWKDIWPAAVARFGKRYRLWLNWPGNPSAN